MSRSLEFRELEPLERRIALMHVAGASEHVIAEFLTMNPQTVGNILARPRVAKFCLMLHGVVSDGLEEGVEDLNKAFKAKASDAFAREHAAMERMDEIAKDNECKPSTRIRANMGVVFTAKDILDRAGYRAAQKVYTYGENSVTPEAAASLADAAREIRMLREAERTIDVTPQQQLPAPSNGNGRENHNS